MSRKKTAKKKPAKKTKPKAKKKPLTAATMKLRALKAAAIVSQVLVHFGSGYGSPKDIQIFAKPKDAKAFSDRLMKSTMKNLEELDWEDFSTCDAVCETAKMHGELARKKAAGKPLTWPVIEKTLRKVKEHCPGGAGGGWVCVE